jgi:hypothetical protein
LSRVCFVLCVDGDADCNDHDDGGHNAYYDEGKFPLNGKGDDERGDKCGYALDCQSQLFGNAVVVDVVAICGGLCGYGGGGCIRIEVCDILADDLLDEVDAQIIGCAYSCNGYTYRVYVNLAEIGNEKVYEIETVCSQRRSQHDQVLGLRTCIC